MKPFFHKPLFVFTLLFGVLFFASCETENEKLQKEENALLKQYIEENNITATPLDGGMYYIELQAGTGRPAEIGKTVSVHYTGMFLDGQVFDSSVARGELFTFKLGAGSVIRGWDIGVAKMKVGDKVRLILPSNLAYGAAGAGNGTIPPYTTLIFDVELFTVR